MSGTCRWTDEGTDGLQVMGTKKVWVAHEGKNGYAALSVRGSGIALESSAALNATLLSALCMSDEP